MYTQFHLRNISTWTNKKMRIQEPHIQNERNTKCETLWKQKQNGIKEFQIEMVHLLLRKNDFYAKGNPRWGNLYRTTRFFFSLALSPSKSSHYFTVQFITVELIADRVPYKCHLASIWSHAKKGIYFIVYSSWIWLTECVSLMCENVLRIFFHHAHSFHYFKHFISIKIVSSFLWWTENFRQIVFKIKYVLLDGHWFSIATGKCMRITEPNRSNNHFCLHEKCLWVNLD